MAPGASGVGAGVDGSWAPVTCPGLDGKLQRGFLQHGLAKSVIKVQ